MGCGLNECYSTQVISVTVAETFTTTEDGHAKTITSKTTIKQTPTPPSPWSTVPTAPTTVSKVPIETSPVEKINVPSPSSGGSGGLTKPQIDGIIAGAVIILVIILVIGFLIITRLNKVKKAVEANSKSYRSYRSWSQSGRSNKKSGKQRKTEPSRSEPPLASSDIYKHVRHPSEPSPIHAIHEMEASPALSSFPFSPEMPASPLFQTHQRQGGNGYAPVPMSDPPSPPAGDQSSFSPITPSSMGTAPSPDLRDQNLRFGHLPHPSDISPNPNRPQHERQWSGDSNMSGFSQASSGLSDQDTIKGGTSVGESSSQRSFYGFRWIRGSRR